MFSQLSKMKDTIKTALGRKMKKLKVVFLDPPDEVNYSYLTFRITETRFYMSILSC